MKKRGEPMFNKFYYGTEYYRYPTPFQKEWEEDFKKMKDMNFNIIKTESAWASMEPAQGKYCWEEMDRLLDMCDKYEMAFIPNIQWEAAPRWVFRDYDVYRIDNHGNIMHPTTYAMTYVGWLMPCFDNPVTRKLCGEFMEKFINRYKDRKCLIAWDVWVEPRSRPGGECACKYSREKYWQWLERQFETIENFNKIMFKRIDRWDDLVPPPYAREYTEMWLWRQWAMASVSDRVKWAAELHSKLDPTKPIMCHVGSCSISQDPVNDSSDDFQNLKSVDFYGSSVGGAMVSDWIRSVSPYFWIMEVYPSVYRYEPPAHEKTRFTVWQSIAHGAKGLEYWQYKAEQFGHESRRYGLLNYNGTSNKTSIEAGKIGKILFEYGEDIHKAEVIPAEAAIFYDHKIDLLSKIEDDSIGFEGVRKGTDYLYKNSLNGIYKILYNSNIRVDFITSYQLGNLDKYKLLYLPATIMLSRKTADVFKNFVKNGGVIIAEANTGMRTENTFTTRLTPGLGLDEMFGCVENEWRQVQDFSKYRFKYEDLEIPAYAFYNHLKLTTSDILAKWEDGTIAMTENKFGKGKAVYIATNISANFFKNDDTNSLKLIKRLMIFNGIKQEVGLEAKGLVTGKVLKNKEKYFVFLFNHEESEQIVRLKSPISNTVKLINDVGNLLEKSSNELVLKIQGKEVSIILEERK